MTTVLSHGKRKIPEKEFNAASKKTVDARRLITNPRQTHAYEKTERGKDQGERLGKGGVEKMIRRANRQRFLGFALKEICIDVADRRPENPGKKKTGRRGGGGVPFMEGQISAKTKQKKKKKVLNPQTKSVKKKSQ